MRRIIIITYMISVALLSVACSPSINYSPLRAAGESTFQGCTLDVLMPEDRITRPVVQIGSLEVGDTGFTIYCDWKTVLSRAKAKACEAGANLLQIYKIREPDWWSTCFRLSAHFFSYPRKSHSRGTVSPNTPAVRESEAEHAKAPSPSIAIQHVELKPGRISGGTPYDIEVTFVASDSSASSTLPIQLNFTVLQKDKLLYTSKTFAVKGENGRPTNYVLRKLASSKRPGAYEILVSISYKDQKASTGTTLVIE